MQPRTALVALLALVSHTTVGLSFYTPALRRAVPPVSVAAVAPPPTAAPPGPVRRLGRTGALALMAAGLLGCSPGAALAKGGGGTQSRAASTSSYTRTLRSSRSRHVERRGGKRSAAASGGFVIENPYAIAAIVTTAVVAGAYQTDQESNIRDGLPPVSSASLDVRREKRKAWVRASLRGSKDVPLIDPPRDGTYEGRYCEEGETGVSTYVLRFDAATFDGVGADADGKFDIEGVYDGTTGCFAWGEQSRDDNLFAEVTMRALDGNADALSGIYEANTGVSGQLTLERKLEEESEARRSRLSRWRYGRGGRR